MRNDGERFSIRDSPHLHYYYLMRFEKKRVKRKKESARIPPKPPGLTGFYSREFFFLVIIIIITFFKASALVDQFFEGPVFDQHPSERTMIMFSSPPPYVYSCSDELCRRLCALCTLIGSVVHDDLRTRGKYNITWSLNVHISVGSITSRPGHVHTRARSSNRIKLLKTFFFGTKFHHVNTIL